MRIVVDVTPLALPRTGIGNYVLGMLRGLGEAGAEHEIVAFSAVAPPGKRRIEEALDGVPVERRLVVVPPKSHWWRTAWSRLGRGPVEWLAGPLDVFHFSDWMYPPQRGGVRATTIHDLVPAPLSGLGAPPDVPHALAEVRARRADVRPDRRQLRVHGRRGRRPARLPAGANLRRLSRASIRLSARTGLRATSAARTSSPSRRSSGARTSRRCSRRCRSSETPPSGASPRRRRRAGLAGPEPGPRGRPRRSATSRTTSSRPSTAAPRRSSIRRASRASACRSSRRWRAARRSSPRPTPRWTRRAATRRSEPIRKRRGDRGRDRAGAGRAGGAGREAASGITKRCSALRAQGEAILLAYENELRALRAGPLRSFPWSSRPASELDRLDLEALRVRVRELEAELDDSSTGARGPGSPARGRAAGSRRRGRT